jgi:hypothetical protein
MSAYHTDREERFTRGNIPTPPPGFRFIAFSGDKACSNNLRAAALFADDIAAAISEEALEGANVSGCRA